MSPRRRAPQPVFATERGEVPSVWEAMPARRLGFLGKWRNPIGLAGAFIVVFIFANLAVDLLYGVLDPRISQE